MPAMQAAPTIRQAHPADFAAWAALRGQLWPESDAAAHLAELGELSRDARFRGWLALDSATPVGFAESFIRPFANGCDSRPVAFLEGIWVAPPYRRRRVGGQLLAAVEHWAGALGIDELGSDADIANALSLLCHGRWGFEEMERVVCFRKRLGPPG
jgi:aminoglycoside 6'-N-acetyltransferase I